MSKAADDITNFLEYEDIKFQKDQRDEDTEIFYFGARGDNELKFLFLVETNRDIVQFRLWNVLEDEEKEILKSDNNKLCQLREYLLYKNYELTLGKWAMDKNDFELNFVIAHHEETSNGLDKSFLKFMKKVLFQTGDDMLTEIKEIIYGNQSASGSEDKSLDELLKSLKGSSGI